MNIEHWSQFEHAQRYLQFKFLLLLLFSIDSTAVQITHIFISIIHLYHNNKYLHCLHCFLSRLFVNTTTIFITNYLK